MILDGTGQKPHRGGVIVSGEHVVAVGECKANPSSCTIDAEGCWLMPGYVDIHGHTDDLIFSRPECESKLLQGVTTEIMGNCGFSVAPATYPLAVARSEFLSRQFNCSVLPRQWTMDEYLNQIEDAGPGINVASLVGHSTLIQMAASEGYKGAGRNLILLNYLQRAMDEGAWGLSAGLSYEPGSSAPAGELEILARGVALHGGVCAAHIRNQGKDVRQAVREFIEVCRDSGARGQISHLKVIRSCSPVNLARVLEDIDTAAEEIDLAFDAYPFDSIWTDFVSFARMMGLRDPVGYELEETMRANGISFEDISLLNPPKIGLGSYNLMELAKSRSVEPVKLLQEMLETVGFKLFVTVRCLNSDGVDKVISHRLASVGTDAPAFPLAWRAKGSHPRAWTTYPTLFSKYLCDSGPLNIEGIVRKVSFLPAQRIGLRKRGAVLPGYYADLVIMKIPEGGVNNVKENFYPIWVLVNGKIAVAHKKLTGVKAGKVLRFGRYEQ